MRAGLIVFAHVGEPLRPHDLWAAWPLEPVTTVALLASAWAYGLGLRRLWHAAGVGRGVRRWEARAFVAGWVVLALSLVSPLHALGGVLFAAHMTQHELLMVVAAPLLLLGRPVVPFLWALPPRGRRVVGDAASRPAIARGWRVLTNPVVAFGAHAVAVWVWHLPALYDATVTSELAHAAQHTSFIATALMFWWVVLRRGGAPIALAILFGTTLHTGVLGALLALAPAPLYDSYLATTGAWGLTPLEDQQLGGLIMWVPGGAAYVIAALALVVRMLRDSETRAERREQARRAVRVAALLVALSACGTDDDVRRDAAMLTGGDPLRGKAAIRQYGCGSCHTIPGVQGANSLVGPPLRGIALRAYIAGVLPNTGQNLVQWIQNPQGVDSKTAMPNLGVTGSDARDIAGYLYTLR